MDSGQLEELARARRRLSLVLSSLMLTIYFGFILSVAFAKRFMGEALVPGLSWGILLGALVILSAFALTGIYVRVANRHDLTHRPGPRDEGTR